MRKRLSTLLLALALTLSLTACGSAGGAGSSSGAVSEGAAPAVGGADIPEEDRAQMPDGSAADEAEPEDGSHELEQPGDTSAGAATPEPEDRPQQKPISKPSKEQKPADSASSGSSSSPVESPVDLAAFYANINTGEEFSSMVELTGELLDAYYAGLQELNLSQCLIYTPMISAVGAEIALAEASSDAETQKVKDIFQARIDYQIKEGAFYPATIEAWENSAKIVANGRYVMLVCGDSADTIVSSFNALFA